jgi:hypothetical protein
VIRADRRSPAGGRSVDAGGLEPAADRRRVSRNIVVAVDVELQEQQQALEALAGS